MKTSRSSSRLLACAAAAAIGTSSLTTVNGDTLTWTGEGANQFFGTAGNWDLNQSPTSVDDVLFPALGLAPSMTPLWEAADSVLSISIDNSGGFVWQLPRSGSVNPRSITIGSGGLSLSGGGTTTWGAVATTIGAPQTWDIASGTTLQFLSGAAITGTNKITKTGAGTIQSAISSTGFSGGWDITAGMFTNAGGFTTNPYGTGATTVSGTGELNLNIAGGGSVSGGAITLANGGTLSGRTGSPQTGDAGVSRIDPSITVDMVANASVVIRATHAGENFRLNSAVSGGIGVDNSQIRIQGPGEVHLLSGSSSATAFLGTWKIETGGTLKAEVTNSLGTRTGADPSRVELAGGTMQWAGTTSGSTPVIFTNPIVVTVDSTMQVDKAGLAGTAANSSGALARTLGPMTIGEHTLSISATPRITGPQVAGPVRMGGNTVALMGDATFNVIKPASYDLLFNTTGIHDGGSGFGITKTGQGWMTIAGTSTYGGATSVLGGTLFVTHTAGLGATSGIHVASGATINLMAGGANNWSTTADLSGGGLFSITGGTGNTLTAQGSAISPGDSAGILNITGSLALALDGSDRASLVIEIVGGGGVAGVDHDQLAVTGTLSGVANADLFVNLSGVSQLDLDGDILTIVTANSNFTGLAFNSVTFSPGASGDVNYNNGSITLSSIVVPEPASMAILSLAGIGILARRRRR